MPDHVSNVGRHEPDTIPIESNKLISNLKSIEFVLILPVTLLLPPFLLHLFHLLALRRRFALVPVILLEFAILLLLPSAKLVLSIFQLLQTVILVLLCIVAGPLFALAAMRATNKLARISVRSAQTTRKQLYSNLPVLVLILEILPLLVMVFVSKLVKISLVVASLHFLILLFKSALLVTFVLVVEGAFLAALLTSA